MRAATRRLLLAAPLAGITLLASSGPQTVGATRTLLEPAPPYTGYDSPDLAVTSAGEVVAVFLGYRPGASESVLAAGVEPRTEPEVLASGAGARFPPRIAAGPDGGVFAVWCEAAEGAANIRLRARLDGRWGPVEAVTEDAHRDAWPELAVTDAGAVWVVWESTGDGAPEVFARERTPGQPPRWGPARCVSEHPASDREPTVAVAPDGVPWVAWTSWRDGSYASGDYEIYARALAEGGAPVCVSRSPEADFGPRLVATGAGLALAWIGAATNHVAVDGLRAAAYDSWSDKHLCVARLEDGAWGAPLAGPNRRRGRPVDHGDHCAVVPGAAEGELWVLFDEVSSSSRGTLTREQRLAVAEPEGIRAPVVLAWDPGSPGQPAAARAGDRLWTADGTPESDSDRPPSISVVAWPLEQVRAARPARGADRSQERDPYAPEPAEGAPPMADLAHAPEPRPRVEWGARTLRPWFGNLHMHTNVSADGIAFEGAPVRNLWAACDVACLDFVSLTDHSGPIGPLTWRDQIRLADLWNRPGSFVTLYGYEWSSPRFGHKNVIFVDAEEAAATTPLEPRKASPTDLWRHLGARRAITIPHAPSHGQARGTDWSYVDDDHQRLVEIFQRRGSYEYDGAPLQPAPGPQFHAGLSVRDALAAGHHLGIIASPDHRGGLGLAGVWAEELTREAVFEALHARRTFGTTGAKMTLWLEVDGQPLGTRVEASRAEVRVRARATGTASGLRLVLVSGGREVLERSFEGTRAELEEPVELESAAGTYLYLRAEQGDGHVGWTSPVWLGE